MSNQTATQNQNPPPVRPKGVPDIANEMLEIALAKRRNTKPAGFRASEIGFPCLRYLCYTQTHWKQRAAPSSGLQGIFATGGDIETIAYRNLSKIAEKYPEFTVARQQETLSDPESGIVGHTDGVVMVENEAVAILEVKSVGYRYNSLHDVESLHSWSIAEKWLYQCQIYMHMSNMHMSNMPMSKLEWTALLLINKLNHYDTKVIWIPYNEKQANYLRNNAIAAKKYLEKNEEPEKINDITYCKGCPFEHVCLPEIQASASANITSPDVLDAWERQKELAKASLEHARVKRIVDKAVKDALPACGEPQYKQPETVTIGEDTLHFEGAKRTIQPTAGGTTFYWRRVKKES